MALPKTEEKLFLCCRGLICLVTDNIFGGHYCTRSGVPVPFNDVRIGAKGVGRRRKVQQ